ncbi:radical SAM protein [bacterium]|nr:radical SAM protein [candidate division CSSED10-310 bacterium]
MNALLDSMAKIDAWRRGEPFAPWEVEVYPTNRCNLRCLFCMQRVETYDYSKELPAAEWLSIIADGAALGVSAWVILGGGEPFARPSVTIPMIRAIKNQGMHGTIITNGTLFTPELIIEMLDLEWDSILFSLESHVPATQDALMAHPGAHKKIVTAIEAFAREKARRNLDRPRLVLQPTITRLNVDHMMGLHQLSHSIGIEFLCFKSFEAFTPEARALRLDEAQKRAFLAHAPKVKEWCDGVGLRTNVHQFRDRRTGCDYQRLNERLAQLDERIKGEYLGMLCHMPWRKMTIKADGGVEPCVGVNRGGMMNGRNLREVWLSAEFHQVRDEVFRKRMLKECAMCGYGIPVTTFEKLRYINKLESFPELMVFDLEIVAP